MNRPLDPPFFRRLAVALAAGAFGCVAIASAAIVPVTTLDDLALADGACSLREAIVAANTNTASADCPAGDGPADRITIGLVGTLTLLSDLPAITEGVGLYGPGRDLLTIDGGGFRRVLAVDAPGVQAFLIRDLRLTGGLAGTGGCLEGGLNAQITLLDVEVDHCTAGSGGGGVFTRNAAWLERVYLHDNLAQGPIGGGGLRHSGGDLTVRNSTISANQATQSNGLGGGVGTITRGRVELSRSTVSGNSAGSVGGGLWVQTLVNESLVLVVTDSTVVGNEADSDASGGQVGGGLSVSVQNAATLDATLTNTVIAGNFDPAPSPCPDLSVSLSPGVTLTSGGFNLLGDNLCAAAAFPVSPGAGMPNAHGDFVGDHASPLDPRLGPLADHGGPMPVHLPLAESPHPLIDQGNCPTADQDQRGFGNLNSGLRRKNVPAVPNNPAGDGCDIGAVEADGAAIPAATIFRDDFDSATTLWWSSQFP